LVRISSDEHGAAVLLAVPGSWDRQLALQVHEVLHKCLAELPAAVIIDLRDLHDPTGASAPLWLTARRTSEDLQPRVRLVVCLAILWSLDSDVCREFLGGLVGPGGMNDAGSGCCG
jgi:hypothetical protein